jgi:hypothetical protein
MDTIGPDAIAAAAAASPLQVEYGQTVDRDSAYERLNAKLAPPPPAQQLPPPLPPVDGGPPPPEEPSFVDEVIHSSAFKSFIRSAATVAGREITRSMFGTGTRRRRRR